MELKEILHNGEFSTIYKGCFENTIYAIKTIPLSNVSLMEVMIGRLESHYLAPIHKIIFAPSQVYVLSELAVDNLSHWITQNIVNIQNIWDWIKSVLLGLQELHVHNIIHGDVRANNLLLYTNNTVKLSSFRHSRFSWLPTHGISSYISTHRAPEIWLLQDWGTSADIWALGCTIFELNTGKNLFPSKSKSLESDLEIIESPYLRKLITQCLTTDPYLRPRVDALLQEYFVILNIPELRIVPKTTVYEPIDVDTEQRIREIVTDNSKLYWEIIMGIRKLLLRIPKNLRTNSTIEILMNIVCNLFSLPQIHPYLGNREKKKY